ncbi:MAG: alkaline phosphatase D family protein [Nocardioides sp.]|uniref:alkaline phosphatase D family protein n=1 Tax=Nocardioides sp. TaxID=35761 RepID=UPI0039E59118
MPTPSRSPFTRRTLLRGSAVAGSGLALAPLLDGAASPAFAAPAHVRSGRPVLTHGVQAADAVSGQATLWSRADRPARLIAEISRDASFRRTRRVTGPVVTADSDLTGRIPVRGLPSGEQLHYRITAVDLDDHRLVSKPVEGRFRTGVTSRKDISFLWSGDIAGQGWGVNPDLGGYRIADAMRAANADFFLCSGDNCYADGPVSESVTLADGRVWHNLVTEEKTHQATTLADYRGQYKYNLLADNYRALLAETTLIAQWDDHEVLNNWYPGEILEGVTGYPDGTAVDELVPRARQAFREYVPVGDASPDRLGRVYRKLSFGPLMDLFILDMRTHKDPNTADLETSDDGGLLGEEQTGWLLREVGRSRATWKVIANDLPLGLVVPDGDLQESASQGDDGAPLGRELNIAHILRSFQRMGVKNHVWLTADVHYTAAHHYDPERAAFTDFDPFWEFVSGPLNAGAFGPNTLDGTFGPEAVFVSAPPTQNYSPLEGAQFFGQVDIEAATEQLTVTLRDVEGAALFTKTLDPERR